jgi:F-type H+-transporting ATPase subunit a
MQKNLDNISSPLEQFEIRDLISIDLPVLLDLHLSLTNIGLYLCLAATTVLTLNLLATNYNKVVANS